MFSLVNKVAQVKEKSDYLSNKIEKPSRTP